MTYLRQHAEKIRQSSRIVIIGAGAVGVQMATDVKELYPEKSVNLVHSRKNVMNKFHSGLHNIIAERCKELGVELVLGSRVKLPPAGYPTDGSTFNVELMDGRQIPSDLAVRHIHSWPSVTSCFLSLTRCFVVDRLQRPDTSIEHSAEPVTRLYRPERLHQDTADVTDQRPRTPKYFRTRRCCGYRCT